MTLPTIAAIAYGILALVGGIWGYFKVKSKPSLISGSISGMILIISGILHHQGNLFGLWLARVVILVLILVFAIRLNKTRQWIPAGLMLIAGAIAFVLMWV